MALNSLPPEVTPAVFGTTVSRCVRILLEAIWREGRCIVIATNNEQKTKEFKV